MADHLAVLEKLAKKWRHSANEPADGSLKTDYDFALEDCAADLEAAIALMRGQSEMSKKVEPAPNWCPTCGRRPNDPHAAFCSNPFHLMPKDTADE